MSARPAVYGGQIVTNRAGKFVGINLGFNFYVEFEHGVNELVQNINKTALSLSPDSSVKDILKLKKKIKQGQKLNSRFRNTPFGEGMILPNIKTFRREIIINNDNIINKYHTFRLVNGEYTVFYMGDVPTAKAWRESFGDKRKFSEEELMYMRDYNLYQGNNPGFMLSKMSKSQADLEQKQFAAVWGSSASFLMILFNKSLSPRNIIDDLEAAIKAGTVSIVAEEPRLFKSHGCCIVDCEEAYLGR